MTDWAACAGSNRPSATRTRLDRHGNVHGQCPECGRECFISPGGKIPRHKDQRVATARG